MEPRSRTAEKGRESLPLEPAPEERLGVLLRCRLVERERDLPLREDESSCHPCDSSGPVLPFPFEDRLGVEAPFPFVPLPFLGECFRTLGVPFLSPPLVRATLSFAKGRT